MLEHMFDIISQKMEKEPCQVGWKGQNKVIIK